MSKYGEYNSMEGENLSAKATFITYPKCEKGQVLILGKYMGEVPNKYNASKPNFKFDTDNGKFILPSSGQLNYIMNDIEVGAILKITYMGKDKILKGTYAGKEVNSFEVLKLKDGEVSKQEVANETSQHVDADLDNLE